MDVNFLFWTLYVRQPAYLYLYRFFDIMTFLLDGKQSTQTKMSCLVQKVEDTDPVMKFSYFDYKGNIIIYPFGIYM